jgi:hypothetical protein
MAVKESKKGAARPRRSKEETQHEFARIQEDVEASQQSTDAKTAEAARLHEIQVRQRVDGVSVEAVVQRISGLGLEVSRALAEVSEKLTAEVQQLAVVREAVVLERRELEQLHSIDVAATALDQLVQDYAREKQKLEAEIADGRRAWEEETARPPIALNLSKGVAGGPSRPPWLDKRTTRICRPAPLSPAARWPCRGGRWRRCRVVAAGRSSARGLRSSLSIAPPSPPCAPPRTAP